MSESNEKDVKRDGAMLKPQALKLLYDNVHDFKTTARHIEEEIARYGIRDDCKDVVPEAGERIHYEMWVSMKTVSHFNLGISLELMLKLLLYGNRKKPPPTHSLRDLYGALPDHVQSKLDSCYVKSFSQSVVDPDLVVFGAPLPGGGPPEELLPKRNIGCLQGLLDYFDQDMIVWQKRYSWELIGKDKWLHYMSNISVVVDFINRVMRNVHRL